MALPDLTGQHIEDTYPRLLHIDSGSKLIYDGTGSLVDAFNVTASFAVTASYAISASFEIIKEVSSSHADTASYVNPLNQDVFINGDLSVTGSVIASGSSFTFIGPITASSDISASGDIISNNLFTGNINSSGSITHTGSINLLSSSISVVDYIDFNNTGITPPPDLEGRIYWDEDNGTLSLGMHGGQVVQQVGLEEYFYIKNQSGVTIPNGSVVRAAGTLGASGRILGDLMIADGSITYYFTLGIATEDIVNGDDGYVTQFGAVRGIDTTGTTVGETWNDGDVLWVSPTVLGGLTKFEPDSPNLKMQMAIVINAASNGTLFVRPDLSSFLTDLHNVNDFTTTASFGDLLVKSGSTWIDSKQLTGSYGLTGSLQADSVIGSFTGSFSGSASLPDLTNSTGITAFIYDGSTEATVQLSGSDGLTVNTIPKWSGNALNNTNITDNGSVVAINSLTNITGSVDVLNGNINLDANSYFLQGTSTGGSNVSLIGVNSQDQIYIGNQGFDNIIADDLAIQGDTTISGSLIVSGSATNDIQLFLPLTSSNDISSSADVYARTGSFDYLGISGNVDIIGDLTVNDIFSQNITSTGSFNHTGSISQIGNTIQIGNYTLTGSFNHSGSYNHIGDTIQVGNYTLTGSLNHTGSYDQVGNTTQIGNYELTGSVNHSGSYDQIGDSTQAGNNTQIGNYTLTGSFNHTGSTTHIGNFSITGNTTLNGALTLATYRLTSSAYTASVNDYRIGVRYTQTGSVSIQLPLIADAGEIEYRFKDEEGNAKKQNITIIASGSDLIDGDTNAILNRNYMAISLYNDGVSNWYIE